MRTTERLLLRPPDATDLERLFAIYGDPRTNAYNPFGPHADVAKSRFVLASWIDHWSQHGFGQWAISARADPSTVIGFGGLTFRRYGDEVKLSLGYRFSVESWGLGYATELGLTALRHAFDELDHSELFAIVRPANTLSIRVLEKVGMTPAGLWDDVPGAAMSLLYRAERPARPT